jgi:hypothetical protein
VEIWSYCLMRWVRGQTGTLHFRFHLRNSRESVFDDRQHVLKCKVPV